MPKRAGNKSKQALAGPSRPPLIFAHLVDRQAIGGLSQHQQKPSRFFLFSSLSTSTSLLHASDSSRPAKQRAISVTLLSLTSSSSSFSFACLLLFFSFVLSASPSQAGGFSLRPDTRISQRRGKNNKKKPTSHLGSPREQARSLTSQPASPLASHD